MSLALDALWESCGQKTLDKKYGRLKKTKISGKLKVPDVWQDFARLCRIRGDQGIQYFNPYDYQIKLVDLIESCPTNVIAKTRQLGISELILNYFTWKAIRIPGYLAVIFSKNGGDTMNLAKRMRRTIENLSAYCDVITNSLTDIEFKGMGRIMFRNSSANGARGIDTAHDLLFDECAFVSEIDDIFKSAVPTTTVMGDRARIIILSTPNGQAGFFWNKLSSNNGDKDIVQICEDIKTEKIAPCQSWIDDHGVGKFLLHWLDHPKYKLQKETYLLDIQQKRGLSMDAVSQEYDLSFLNAESIVFSSELIRKAIVGNWEKETDPDGSYYIGIDTSLLGDDYFVVVVLKFKNMKYHLVDMYRKRKQTSEFNIFNSSDLIEKYNPVSVGIEVNAAGEMYCQRIMSLHSDKTIEKIKTTAQSKPVMIARLMLAMEQNILILPDDRIVKDEFLSFRNIDGALKAISSSHDDIILALSFALTVADFGK